MQVFVLERLIPPLVITFTGRSPASRQIIFLHYFCFCSILMDPVQNLSIKMKTYPWTWSMTGGPWTPGPCFVLWIQSNHRIEFSNLSFQIAHLPAGRLTCANSGEIFLTDPPSSGFMNGDRQNFPPIHTSGMSLSSQAYRSSDRLYM